MSHLSVQQTSPGHARILLDGIDIAAAITQLQLTMTPKGTLAIVDLMLGELVLFGEAQLKIADESRDLLIAHGWTPPQETP